MYNSENLQVFNNFSHLVYSPYRTIYFLYFGQIKLSKPYKA